jgi:hypothetical protein
VSAMRRALRALESPPDPVLLPQIQVWLAEARQYAGLALDEDLAALADDRTVVISDYDTNATLIPSASEADLIRLHAERTNSVESAEGLLAEYAEAVRSAQPWGAKTLFYSLDHTIADHVGRTLDQLRHRFDEPGHENDTAESSFINAAAADAGIIACVSGNEKAIRQWRQRSWQRFQHFEHDMPYAIGVRITRVGRHDPPELCVRVRVVLTADPRSPRGYSVYTAFPV